MAIVKRTASDRSFVYVIYRPFHKYIELNDK